MRDTSELLAKLSDILSDYLQQSSELKLTKNAGPEDSIHVHILPSAYRSNEEKNCLFARVKLKGQHQYISFSKNYGKLFKAKNIPFVKVGKQTYHRIPIDLFEQLLDQREPISQILKDIFVSLFAFDEFGCCSSYVECSDRAKCIHPDPVFASACQYRVNLEAGHIFYGKNKTI